MSDIGPRRYRILEGATKPVEAGRGWPAPRIARLLVDVLCWAYGLALCAFHAATAFAPAASWPVHLLLYGPRWLAALPVLLLIPLAAVLRRRWCTVPLSLGLYSFAAIWGLNIPWERLLVAGGAAGEPLRVLTCNVQGRDLKVQVLADFIAATRPDVLCLQECTLTDAPGALGLDGWFYQSYGEHRILSRYPIIDFAPIRVTEGRPRTVAVRARLMRSGQEIPVVSVHLMSPRWGLEAIINQQWRGLPAFRSVVAVHESESRQLRRRLADVLDSAVVAGDFNLTAEQPIFRRDWSDVRDAFSWTSWGLGHTMFTRSIGLRIDHILCGSAWTPRSCQVGPDVGSAHLPVVAELAESP